LSIEQAYRRALRLQGHRDPGTVLIAQYVARLFVRHLKYFHFVAKMLGLQILLTSAVAGAVASAGFLPEVANNAAFPYNGRRQVANGTTKAFHGPYSTQGRDIVDSRGEKITWAGVNWPMSGKLHISHQRIYTHSRSRGNHGS
jgi:hypothetical protein